MGILAERRPRGPSQSPIGATTSGIVHALLDRYAARISIAPVPGTDMANSNASSSPPAADDTAAYLDMPPERRAAAKAHAALLSRTADRIARELPMSADVDDFRRVLAQEAKP
jgi:hypothetical protein